MTNAKLPCYLRPVNEQPPEGVSSSEQNKTPKTPEKPAGMSEEAWERMNLVWGAIKGLLTPPSENAKQATAGDKSMDFDYHR